MSTKNKRNENWMKQRGYMSPNADSKKASGKYQKHCPVSNVIQLPRRSRRGA